jgi:hypothetical protein
MCGATVPWATSTAESSPPGGTTPATGLPLLVLTNYRLRPVRENPILPSQMKVFGVFSTIQNQFMRGS